jgi:hypothetical protein
MRPHFSIRDLLWMTLVAGVCAGWFLEHRKWTAQPLVRLYCIQHVDAAIVANVLATVFQNTHGVQFTVDERTNTVAVSGSLDFQEIAKKLIETMDQSPSPIPMLKPALSYSN